jgi:23S rRNA (guanine745-N1)-methyltransferase
MLLITPPDNLCCPLDGDALLRDDGRYLCSNGHSFDIARQGYLNLLLVQQKKSREPGDSREMVDARKAFLDTGVYEPVAEMLVTEVSKAITGLEQAVILDAGCGEGYYTDFLLRHMQNAWSGERLSVIGLDISKPAVISAARRNPEICWLVGTNRKIPVLPDSVDVIVSLFGYPQFPHFRELLKPGGTLVIADTGSQHLVELRELLYDTVRFSEAPGLAEAIETGFELTGKHSLTFETRELSSPELLDLARMTPHYFRAPRIKREQLEQVESLKCHVDVLFRTLVSGN